MREGSLFLLLAVIIGLFSGLSVVCFRILIDWTRISLFGSALYPGYPRVVIVPALAGLVLAFLVVRFFPSVRGSGVTQTKSAVYVYDDTFRLTPLSESSFAARWRSKRAIAWAGGPFAANGRGIASLLGRKLRLSREKFG